MKITGKFRKAILALVLITVTATAIACLDKRPDLEATPANPGPEVRRYGECMARKSPDVGFWIGYASSDDTLEYITARCHRLIPPATKRRDTG